MSQSAQLIKVQNKKYKEKNEVEYTVCYSTVQGIQGEK